MTFDFTVKEFILGGGTGTPTFTFYRRGFNLGGSAQPTWKDVVISGIGSLTLVNAKANGLNYLKLFGGCEQDGTPTPTNPVDIVCNNGAIKFSPNEANYIEDNVTLGYWLRNTDGNPELSSANFYTNYMPVKPNVSYIAYGRNKSNDVISGYNRIAWYDIDKNWISNTTYTANTIGKGIAPANAYFARFHCNINGSTITQELVDNYNWTFRMGTEEMPFIPYVSESGLYVDGTTETVEVTGKNLFDKDSTPYQTGAYITSATVGNSTFQMSAHSNYNIYRIDIQPNTTYTFGIIKANAPYWVVTDGSIILDCSANNGGTEGTNITITTPANAKYLYLSVGVNGTYKCDDILQLELGSTATEYEPYYYGGQATAEMLLKVGDYQDVQSVIDGEVTRKVGIKVLDGSEWWTQSAATNNLFYTTINNSSTDNTYIPVSSNFQGVVASTGYATMTNGQFKHGSSTNSWYFKNTDCANATAFSQWLADQYNAGTPVIIVYPLATPTTETVTGQPLTIQAGTNIVEITQASIDNLELEVSYKAGVEVTVEEIEAVNNDESVEVTING